MTSKDVYLRQKTLSETHNHGLGGGEESGTGGKETKQRRQVGLRDGKDMRRVENRRQADDDESKEKLIQQRLRAVTCAVEILREDKGILIGVIEVGSYVKLTCAALARTLGLNGSITAVTCQVDQAWFSQMVAKGILKIFSGTVPYCVTQEARCTSSNLEASYSLHAIDMVKAEISEYNTSYEENVEGSEEIIVTHPSHIICYENTRFQLTQKGTIINTNVERTLRASEGYTG